MRLAQFTGVRLVIAVCVAQVLVQIGAFVWPALLPTLMRQWALSNAQSGWITAVFYGAYMLSVPVLVTLTDRISARSVYLFGVGCTIAGHVLFAWLAEGLWSALVARALTGLGWAGTYMTGVKLLADQVDAKLMSRAVAAHAASIGVSGALSFAFADVLATAYGPYAAFAAAASTAAFAWLIVATVAPRAQPKAPAADGGALFDFRPVFRNRSAMAYAQAYCIHTLEMNALRGWGVAFLAFVALQAPASEWRLGPAAVLTAVGLVGTAASVLGNEAAIRIGRRALITIAMSGSIVLALSLGLGGAFSYELAVVLLLAYGFVVWLDSASLTAGAAGTAEPSRRGATLAVHSALGYAGGFIGPLMVGYTLDVLGGTTRAGWAASFLLVATLMLCALIAFRVMRPRELAGDRRP
jgi:MFS family permease